MQLNRLETAAEAACDIFNTLSTEDKKALTIRLVAIGALNAGSLDFIVDVCEAAQESVLKLVRQPKAPKISDESYIINLVDEVLGMKAARQYRFDFLKGDTGRRLPVDAYYLGLNLAVEYHERQHTEAVPHMDKRMTASGVTRGEQRKLYDQRRRTVLPANGVMLLVLDYSLFACDGSKRLTRADKAADIAVIEKAIAQSAK